ncbi:MAG: UDP-N-acetylmuramoyl-L-alanyl-D-glutamate--2,6-diaminopimelate ligase, partial [Mucilaginibacter sp.]|nr:UDP-N-acetylmuramoyl-L-alanyl-D-glutamate--2,6-diaminopimelate ligase [Mucilaginibacter sp.]
MRYLSDIIDGLAFTELQGSADVEITAIAFDSRAVIPGSMFVAVKGTVVDGHDYIEQAIKKGAVAVICEDLPAHTTGEVDFL